MNKPFFSILLPTKNRAHLVGYAIRSVLNQNFEDFELIIADNDDRDATSQVVAEFQDQRIHYVRTGGLDMVQNWNTALDKSIGEYIIILEDKFIFYPGAFDHLYRFIKQKHADVVTWRIDVIDDVHRLYRKTFPFKEESIATDVVLQEFLRKRTRVWLRLPRGLCTAIHRSVIYRAQQEFSGPFYDYLSPDLVSALKVLTVGRKIDYLGRNLNCITSIKASNAIFVRILRDGGSYYGRNVFVRTALKVPVKNRWICANTIAHDIEVTLRERKYKNILNIPYYQKYKRSYYTSLFYEVGITSAESPGCYRWSELKELLKKNGWDIIPYFYLLYSFVRGMAKRLIVKIYSRYCSYRDYVDLVEELINGTNK